MANSIDCTSMCHPACQEPDPDATPLPSPPSQAPMPAPSASELPSFDCVNFCVSNLGVASLVEGTLAGLGCALAPPSCPEMLGIALGSVIGVCAHECDEQAAKSRGAR
jgi:hypothetical protein